MITLSGYCLQALKLILDSQCISLRVMVWDFTLLLFHHIILLAKVVTDVDNVEGILLFQIRTELPLAGTNSNKLPKIR